uniref:Ig-like domain-containing protein n=1 Tax=Pavo cristatus TaxID=9049 RepID=A0A8C9FLS6_PAVCR
MELRVILLLLLCCPGLRAQTPETEMSQREGSTFSIQCPYTTQPDNKQLKAWCRMRNARCELLVLTLASREYQYSDRARQGHITIQDDNRTVSITMSDLQAEDSGIYSCMYSSNYVPLKTILLNVYKELHKRELDSLSVQCPYRALGYSEGRKAWCRQQGQAECSLIVSTAYPYTWGSTGARNKSSSIQDDAQTGIATITMNKLQAQDSGVYWCALYNPYQRPAFTRIMEVRLSVDKSEYLLADFGLISLAQSPLSLCPTKKEPSVVHVQHRPTSLPAEPTLGVPEPLRTTDLYENMAGCRFQVHFPTLPSTFCAVQLSASSGGVH